MIGVASANHPHSEPRACSGFVRHAMSETITRPPAFVTRESSISAGSSPTIEGPPMQYAASTDSLRTGSHRPLARTSVTISRRLKCQNLAAAM